MAPADASAKPRVGVPYTSCARVPSSRTLKVSACTTIVPSVVSRTGKVLDGKAGPTDYRIVRNGRTWHLYTSPAVGPCATRIGYEASMADGRPVFLLQGCGPAGGWFCAPSDDKLYCDDESQVALD